ncbi:hypothetical protein JOC85_002581 [Bacillus mesophilus]|uniref:Uncharacterized protein n=1 Tax=Bacillus mesophilus TaxID=1808955 RepID=A0A6M0Q7V0_9BACI|nr:hypothetical protein [Bacillus mesophilus]MBM7661778.1 hypothetical protein [Bacillus mesophilus]NEY72436.1 hypothetical protein [Bacillus mesophilus]
MDKLLFIIAWDMPFSFGSRLFLFTLEFLSSDYSQMLGIPIDYLDLAYYYAASRSLILDFMCMLKESSDEGKGSFSVLES